MQNEYLRNRYRERYQNATFSIFYIRQYLKKENLKGSLLPQKSRK